MEWARQWQEYNQERSKAEAERKTRTPRPPRQLPGALTILRDYVHREGVGTLIGYPRRPPEMPHPAQYKLTNHPALGGNVTGDQGGHDFLKNTRRSLPAKGFARTVLTFVPPYTIGFLAWAITSGDLQ